MNTRSGYALAARVRRLPLVLFAAIACASPARTPSPAPAPEPAPREGPSPAAPVPEVPGRATFAYAPGELRYTVTSSTRVSMPGDTTGLRDSVLTELVLRATLSPERDGAWLVAGQVDSFAVSRTGSILTVPQQIQSPVPFRGVLPVAGGGGVMFDPAPSGGGDCESARDRMLLATREPFVPLPVGVSSGARWSDSVVTTTCRNGLRLTSRAERHYSASDAPEEDGALVVMRTSAVNVSAADTIRGQLVSVTGFGADTATLRFDRLAGRLSAIAGRGRVTLTVSGGGRDRMFVQDVEHRVVLRP